MSRQKSSSYAPPCGTFHHNSLELTLRLLNQYSPPLAVELHRALRGYLIPLPQGVSREGCPKSELVQALAPITLSRIITLLTLLARRALDQPASAPEKPAILHGLIEDWSDLAQWWLEHSTPMVNEAG